jgi:hypothetical protein
MKLSQPYYLILAYCYYVNKVIRLGFVIANNFLLRLVAPNLCDLYWAKESLHKSQIINLKSSNGTYFVQQNKNCSHSRPRF